MQVGVFMRTSEVNVDDQPIRFRDILGFAQAAEAAGLDSFWVPDHLTFESPEGETFGVWDAYSIMSGLAAATSRIRIGPFVTASIFRNPALLAKMAATIDDISDGRFVLGLGAGNWEAEHTAFGFPFDRRASRLGEALQIIRPLFRDGSVDFQGTYHLAKTQHRPAGPTDGGPPLWVAAKGPRLTRTAVQFADALISIWPANLAQVTAERSRINAACADVGRDPSTIEHIIGTHLYLPAGTPNEIGDNAISGSTDEIVATLRSFADAGVAHVVVDLRPDVSMAGIAELGEIVARLRQ